MEIDDSLGPELALHLTHAPRSAPGRVGQRLLQSPGRRLDIVGVPRDPRGIVLACGSAAVAALAILPAPPRNVRGGTKAALSNIPVSNGSDSSPNGQAAVAVADGVDPPEETPTAQGARSRRPVRVQALGEFRFEVSGRDIAP